MPTLPHAGPDSRLPRSLSLSQMSMVGFGAVISLGLISGTVLPLDLAGPATGWVYVAAIVMLMLLINCMATLTMADSVPRSFSEAVAQHLGRRAGGFTRGAYFLTVTVIVGTEAAFLPSALRPWMPWLPDWLLGLSSLLLLALVIGHGARAFARMEVVLAVLKIGAMLGLLVLGCRVIVSGEDVPALGARWLHDMLQVDARALWASFVLATLGFVGIESLSLAARETSAAPPVLRARMVSVARWLGLLVWVTIAVTSLLTYTGAVPLSLSPSQYLLTLWLSGLRAHLLFGVLIALTVLSVLNSQLYSASRVLHESAWAGELPGALGRLDAGSPRVATLAAFLCAAAVFLATVYDTLDTFRMTTSIAVVGALMVWSLVFMAALRFAAGKGAGGRSRSLLFWQALLGLLVTLMIVASLPFLKFFGPEIWIGVPPLLAVGIGAAAVGAYRGRKTAGAA